MNIKHHGKWALYTPNKGHPDAPPNTLYAKNEKGVDWYDYIRGDYFREDSVKVMCSYQSNMWIVGPAVREADWLFPANQMVLEITDFGSGNPQEYFINKAYDTNANKFVDAPSLEERLKGGSNDS